MEEQSIVVDPEPIVARGKGFQSREEAVEAGRRGAETNRLLRLAGKLGSSTGTSRRRKILENAAWWAAQAKEDAKGKTKLQQMLLEFRNRDPVAFVRGILMQVLPQAPKLPAIVPGKEETASEVLGDSLELLNRWWDERNSSK